MLLMYLLVALSSLLGLVSLMWKYPVTVAVLSLIAVIVSDLTGVGIEGLQFGIGIYPRDIACAALIVCCVVVHVQRRSLPWDLCFPALLLLGLGILNFGRGALAFGVKPSGNEARDLVNLILPVVAFSALGSTIRMNVSRLATCLSLISLLLAAFAAARWTGVLAMPPQDYDDLREVVRVLPSDYAIIIGQALIAVLGIQLVRGFQISGLILAGLFAGLVFALQHRSVWVATAAGVVWLALRSPRLTRQEWLKFWSLTLVLAAAFTLVPLLASGVMDKALNLFHSNVQEVSHDDSTWAWRIQGYLEATQRVFSNGFSEAVVGPPSGRDLTDTASFASIHIHDRYLQVLAFYGVTGLLVLLAWLLSTAGRIQRLVTSGNRHARIDKVILEALLVSALVYFVPYSGGQIEGSVLGAIWLASAARRSEADSADLAPEPATILTSFAWQTTGTAPVPAMRSAR